MSQSRIKKNIWDRDRANGYIFPYYTGDKVGIGTETPAVELDIIGDVNFVNANFSGVIDGVTSDGIKTGSATDIYKIGFSIYRDDILVGTIDNSSGDFRFKSQNTNSLQFINDLNVGFQVDETSVIDVVGVPTMSTAFQALVDHNNTSNKQGGTSGEYYHLTSAQHGQIPAAALTEGSVVFAGVGGVLSEDNANFFWDDTDNELQSPTIRGSSVSGEDLTITSTSNATKGSVKIGTLAEFDEALATFGLGTAPTSDTKFTIKGLGNTSATNTFDFQNSDGVSVLKGRDDGVIAVGDIAPQANYAQTIKGNTFGTYYDVVAGTYAIYFKNSNSLIGAPTYLSFYTSGKPLIIEGTSIYSNSTASGLSLIGYDSNGGTFPAKSVDVIGGKSFQSATATEEDGADANITGGQGNALTTGGANGGDVVISGGTGYGTGSDGKVKIKSAIYKKPTKVLTTPYNILTTDNFVSVNLTVAGATTLNLPPLSTAWDSTTGTGLVLTIKDGKGDAGTNNITIAENVADTNSITDIATGQSSTSITGDGDSITIRATSATTWEVLNSTSSFAGDVSVAGSVQIADDTDTCDATKVGALRYNADANNSYCDMCMQTGAATYAWNNIVQNNW